MFAQAGSVKYLVQGRARHAAHREHGGNFANGAQVSAAYAAGGGGANQAGYGMNLNYFSVVFAVVGAGGA